MLITDKEKEYIGKIYRHGLNHLIDDTIPNKLICIHNIHWCVETLLRKATQDWQKIKYKDGFDEIFKKFYNRYEQSLSPSLKLAVENLNESRNGIQHRGIYPDINFLQGILPKIYKFIKWMMKHVFKTDFDISSIPTI